MKNQRLIPALALALVLTAVGLVLAGGGVERPRWALGSGAVESTAAGVALRATLGQPVVGGVSGGNTAIGQGFWHDTASEYTICLPLVIRD
jgi:hypothetical protein